MKLASFRREDGTTSYGIVEGQDLLPVPAAVQARWPDLKAALNDLQDVLAATRQQKASRMPLSAVALLAPIPQPDKIICVGLNYASHVAETGRETPKHPSIFTRYPASIVGHGAPILRPSVSDRFDYEGELAVVIGRSARHVPAERALDHVAGYAPFNDGSIRDWQRHTSQFWPGKSFQLSGAMGPWIVTADEIPDPAALTLETRLNGEIVQKAGLDDLVFDVPALIAYLSTVIELLPGDVIATGTPGGVGLFRDPPRFLRPGDVVEVEISRLGTLRNPVCDEAA